MKRSNELLIALLIEAVPGLKSLHDEHLANYDELLPHVFFGDVTRYVTGCFTSGNELEGTSRRRDGLRILQMLEEAFKAEDPVVQELISTSFLENIDWFGPEGRAISSAIGPALRQEKSRLDEP